MNQNELEDFLVKSATLMSEDRPDVWAYDDAYQTITRWYENLDSIAKDGPSSISSGGFELHRHSNLENEGEVEWMLNRNLYSLDFFKSQEQPFSFDWTENSTFIKP
jgi:hypothetical protein